MNWKKLLPEPNLEDKKTPKTFTVRLNEEQSKWVLAKSIEHRVSMNEVLKAIIVSAKDCEENSCEQI